MTQAPYYVTDAGEVGCHSSPAYVITSAGIETRSLRVGGMPTSHPDAAALCGIEDALWVGWTLPRVAEIMQRICPFATTWCAPFFEGSGALEGPWMGYAQGTTALIRSSLSPREAVETAYHEAYHLIEAALPDVWSVLDGLVDHAVPWPDDYLRQPWERRARMFETFAMHLSEGGAVPLAGDVPRLLGAIFSGEVGRAIAASREPPLPSLFRRMKELAHV